uniref:Uncharacterized protein n=1 Tax=Amphimedon queenslandica TaxID=400682 RepID=A0A1X7T5V3_AMPQE
MIHSHHCTKTWAKNPAYIKNG